MNGTADLLFKAVSETVFGNSAQIPEALSREELKDLYDYSQSQDLCAVVSKFLLSHSLCKDSEYSELFGESELSAISKMTRLEYDEGLIASAFEKAGIDFISLKGAVIRYLYPIPYFRTSCDLDILVKESDLDRASDILASSLGFCENDRWRHDISFTSKSGDRIELHFCLGEYISVGSVLGKVWENTRAVTGFEHKKEMTPEFFIFYHIAHMSRHFVLGGCGIRPFADLALMIRKLSFSEEKLESLLTEGGLLKFYRAAVSLSEAWFFGGEKGDVGKQMEEVIIGSGLYGDTKNRALFVGSRKGRVGGLAARLWCPREVLVSQFPTASNSLFVPYYQAKRIFSYVKKFGAGRVRKEFAMMVSVDSQKKKETKEMLSSLGLYDSNLI